MVNVFKIKKGLDINLKGKAERIKVRTGASDEFVLSPASFEGVVPKVVVREGEHVDAGQALFPMIWHIRIMCCSIQSSPTSLSVSSKCLSH